MKAQKVRRTISRRQAAALLGLEHQDSASRLLRDGLAYAIVERGGRGKTARFDAGRVERWQRARTCRRSSGLPCADCSIVLEDARCVAAHVLAAGHAPGGCAECRAPGGLWEPCSPRLIRRP